MKRGEVAGHGRVAVLVASRGLERAIGACEGAMHTRCIIFCRSVRRYSERALRQSTDTGDVTQALNLAVVSPEALTTRIFCSPLRRAYSVQTTLSP